MTLRRAAWCFAFVALSACGRDSNNGSSTDITGAMPSLEFRMQRASDGAEVTARDYRGKVVILYFGYTNCPDLCPATLTNLSDVLERFGAKAMDVRILFVTVDPNRDTLPVLRAYVRAFAKQTEGLRGDDDALAGLARRYRVTYGVEGPSPGRGYNVMHSDAVFFFDREGRARLVVTSTEDVAGIAGDLRRLLD
jgi:protein SCO1/2